MLLASFELLDGPCKEVRMERNGDSTPSNAPLRAYMIQRRNPLRVKANGMIKRSRSSADVDSSSSSTMPMA
jgi:hypothetical protein